MSSAKLIIVFGSTGVQGGAVVKALSSDAAQDYVILAVTRDPTSARSTALAALPRVSLLPYDPEDTAGLFAEVRTIAEKRGASLHAVFSVQNAHQANEVTQGVEISNAAGKAGFKHFVYSSVDSAGKRPTGVSVCIVDAPFPRWWRVSLMGRYDTKLEIEEHVRRLSTESKTTWTILRPTWFMDNWQRPEMRFAMFAEFSPQATYKLIASDDLGEVAALAIAQPEKFSGRTIELAGDELTLRQAKDALEKHTGESYTLTGPEVLPPPALPLFQFNATTPFLADVAKTKGEFPFVMDFAAFLAAH